MFYFTLDISLKYLEIKKNLQKKTMIPTGNNNSLLDFSPQKNAYKMFNAYYFIQFYIFVFFGGFFSKYLTETISFLIWQCLYEKNIEKKHE